MKQVLYTPMSTEPAEEQRKLAIEIFGGEKEANYMLVGTGMRHDMTVKMLEGLLVADRIVRSAETTLRFTEQALIEMQQRADGYEAANNALIEKLEVAESQWHDRQALLQALDDLVEDPKPPLRADECETLAMQVLVQQCNRHGYDGTEPLMGWIEKKLRAAAVATAKGWGG